MFDNQQPFPPPVPQTTVPPMPNNQFTGQQAPAPLPNGRQAPFSPQAGGESPSPVEDMFAGRPDVPVPSAGFNQQYPQSTQPFAGQTQYSQVSPGQYAAPANVSYEDMFGGRKLNLTKVILIGGIALIVVGSVIAGVLAYGYWTNSKQQANLPATDNGQQNNIAATTTNQENGQNQNNQQPVTTTEPETIIPTSTLQFPEENKDSDSDGLTDLEEKTLNTNPLMADTDSDGLSDWAEVKLYKTDPLNPDTDGDGFKDGQEVIGNYDPTKPGNARLRELPNSTTTQ